MITYRKLQLIRVAEFHFEESCGARADIMRHLWLPAPLAGFACEPSYTLVLDLTESPEALLAGMHHDTRYRIRRSQKETLHCEFWPAPGQQELNEFRAFYDDFAAHKHLVRMNRGRLEALWKGGWLELSRIRDAAGRVLIWHAYYRGQGRARLIYSASILKPGLDPSIRSLVGTASRYHTWRDMQHYQQQGLAVFDLGGWYGGVEDPEKLRINTFKRSFGGVVIKEFNYETGVTARGTLALHSKAMLLNILFRRPGPLRPTEGQSASTAQ